LNLIFIALFSLEMAPSYCGPDSVIIAISGPSIITIIKKTTMFV
jgi:hypothetical protein